jgi:hypothetical protein
MHKHETKPGKWTAIKHQNCTQGSNNDHMHTKFAAIPVDIDPKKFSRNLNITTKMFWLEALVLRDAMVLMMMGVKTDSEKAKYEAKEMKILS